MGESIQLEEFNNIIGRMNNELNKMTQHIQAMDGTEIIGSFVNIARMQTEVYQLFMNPRFALLMYDTYFDYIMESTRKNTQILSQIPAGCVPTRRSQPIQ